MFRNFRIVGGFRQNQVLERVITEGYHILAYYMSKNTDSIPRGYTIAMSDESGGSARPREL